MSENGWLNNLKAGDEVIVARSSYGRSYRTVEQVERVSSTQIAVDRKRFRRKTGWQCGEGHHLAWLQEATPEAKAEIAEATRRNILINKIESANWKHVPTAVLVQIDALLQRPSASTEDSNPTESKV